MKLISILVEKPVLKDKNIIISIIILFVNSRFAEPEWRLRAPWWPTGRRCTSWTLLPLHLPEYQATYNSFHNTYNNINLYIRDTAHYLTLFSAMSKSVMFTYRIYRIQFFLKLQCNSKCQKGKFINNSIDDRNLEWGKYLSKPQ